VGVRRLQQLGVAWEVVRWIAPHGHIPSCLDGRPGNVLAALPLIVINRSRRTERVALLLEAHSRAGDCVPSTRRLSNSRPNESVREMAVADLLEDMRHLSSLERDFLDRWRAALGMMTSTPQLARVFARVKLLAAVEAKAQRDQDAAILAAIEQVEFEGQSPNVDDRPVKD
jgi:hypothetical protein